MPYSQMTMMMTMITKKVDPQTPLGQLILEKREIRRQCQVAEAHLKEDWQFIRSHAGRLLLSELSAAIVPGRKKEEGQGGGKGFLNSPWVHTAWQIAKPIAYRWMGEAGWQVFKSMFRHKRK